ncbi:FecCD family ABC transporter permease [Aureimonas jatrophae]|uniref:Iron complex transport system permease protein n=1 Tax=Aureimonas jatrophae TaxID=1166073 RepID=A0A1H0L5D9_9HYPH|nr:iron chelate uptake ABC transporter family permease subunit [Aureimonas jatrophae]MBB3952411.1 iron complex transport system permease protein [Aureimonas jatrophae]SDO63246.1 iron complex transport system permease protein [Aureimonas jatrophae]
MRLALAAALLVVAALLALSLGVRPLGLAEVWHAIAAFDPRNPDHVAVRLVRLPRVVAGLIAGAGLGIAGSVMQGLTRNPLADPGILGVSAGSALAVVLGSLFLARADSGSLAFLAFPGAALAAVAVFALGGALRGDAGPVRLVLAGAALNALLLSLVSAVVLTRSDSLEVFRFWVNGSLAQAGERPLASMALVALAGSLLAFAAAPVLETLSLGNTMARGLGTRLLRAQGIALLVVTLLTGASVAVAGPVAFLGLMVPPLARRLAGHALRAELVASALLGAALLLLADTLGRLVIAPAELRVGLMSALVGGPIFVLLVRRLPLGSRA